MDTTGTIVISHKDDVLKELGDKLGIALETIGMAGEANAKLEITKLVYDTPESPNYKRTGKLRNSLTHTDNGKDTVYIGTNVEYASAVEYGTKRIPPRPYLKNAVEKHSDEYKEIIDEILRE